jgi:hypothetical protein
MRILKLNEINKKKTINLLANEPILATVEGHTY